MKDDVIKSPAHYTQGKIECHQAVREALGDDGYCSWCIGNIFKYLWRHKYKNGIEDLEKAQQFLDMMMRVKKDSPYT